jgi:uncharacterized membrane-anchored protein YhcB (DUF1043 family)
MVLTAWLTPAIDLILGVVTDFLAVKSIEGIVHHE